MRIVITDNAEEKLYTDKPIILLYSKKMYNITLMWPTKYSERKRYLKVNIYLCYVIN